MKDIAEHRIGGERNVGTVKVELVVVALDRSRVLQCRAHPVVRVARAEQR
jgi:hypothetical protein